MKKLITLVCLVAILWQVTAQTYTNFVMEGAGVRGIAYVVAIRVLEREGVS